jgi:hypothetical protein
LTPTGVGANEEDGETPLPATRESIERTLRELNDAENSLSMSPVDKSAVVDRLSTGDVHGWLNGADRGDRDAERQFEAFLWATFPNYHRTFEAVLIDVPRAAVQWRMTGSSDEMEVDLSGTTFLTFDDDSRIREFWLYFHDPLA